jgi:hypothetical protein
MPLPGVARLTHRSESDCDNLTTGPEPPGDEAMNVKEQVLHEIDSLDEEDLHQVARYLGFLKSRPRSRAFPEGPEELAALYAEFAEEDIHLAEQGLAD